MLYFHNQVEIDIRGATIAGLSAKDNATPIGFFGTGLKYSIACILRWNGEITIYSGLTEHRFTKEEITFRGKSVFQVLHNGVPCGFTTEYGKNWLPWQVFRELYANALDEGGTVVDYPLTPYQGITIVAVTCSELEKLFHERDSIILPAYQNYFHETSVGKVASGTSNHIYYRGVRVSDTPSIHTYNITQELDLTEDRTVKYNFMLEVRIMTLIQSMTDEDAILTALSAPKGMREARFADYPAANPCSEAFISVARRLYKQDKAKWSCLSDVIKAHAADLLAYEVIKLSPMRQKMLDRAKVLCERMGYSIDWPVHVANLGNSTLGQWDQAVGVIRLSPTVFDQGTKAIVSTLYEELTHAHTGKADCNYDMQTHLFNTIVSLYEEHVFGEPI